MVIPDKKKKSILVKIRENLLLGLITLAPFVITLWIFISVVQFLDQAVYVFFPADVARVPGIGFVVTFILLLFFGTMTRTVSGRLFNSWTDALLRRIPVVRGLYGVIKQMSNALFSKDAHSAFKRVVRVPFPHAESHTLGFVTGAYSEHESFVFVPTSPNPTSGYVLIFRNELVEDSNMPIQEALQLVVSCGATAKH